MRKIAGKILNKINHFLSKEKREQLRLNNEFNAKLVSLKNTPRFHSVTSDLLGRKLLIPDATSFLFIYDEIFVKEIYKFEATKKDPVIIDCGANIGLSILYFKNIYPSAKIIGFEPDPKIFSILKNNISSFDYQDVELINNALWEEEKELDFYSEGADAGRLSNTTDKTSMIKIKAVKLSTFLDSPVDLLKIDIEGAEYAVLKECQDKLKNVNKLFVEYHSFLNEEQMLDEILRILKNEGFRYNINQIGIVSKQPFVKVNNYSGMDLQMNIFAYR
jgi:FkbM family methyltransferase